MSAMILSIISIFLWGRLALRVVFGRRRVEFFLRLPLMFGLGCFAVAWLLFIYLLAGGRMSAAVAWVTCALPFAVLIIEGIRRLVRRRSVPAAPPRRRTERRWYVRATQAACLLLVAGVTVTILHDSQKVPLTGDARHIWGYKAKIIYYESLYSEDFQDTTQVHQHPNYPLLVPVIEAYSYALMGGVDDRRVKIIFPVFYVCLLMGLYAEVRRHLGPLIAPVLTALFATFFPLKLCVAGFGEGSASTGYADVPLTFFYTLGVIVLFRWLSSRTITARDDRRSRFAAVICAALMFAAALFTKNEGLPLAVIACTSALFVVLTGRASAARREVASLLLMAGIILVVSLPWLAWRAGLPAIDENYASRLTVDNVEYGLAHHADAVVRYSVNFNTPVGMVGRVGVRPLRAMDAWSIFWPMLAVTCVLYIARCFRKNTLFVAMLLAGHVLLYFVILLIVPPSAWKIEELLRFITHRLFMHFSGVALILMAALPGQSPSASRARTSLMASS
jgi:hypothetical protein